ncbi:hypothetical protein [Jatrophihabitans sp.]|uniref:hypothetical protein n=1 Tax=Jatrophihabitans sp. TaxID=1932789 RepID=UPI002BE8CD5C|nr:hypothetical protein [Jatrophihabitans sp.]
MTRPPFGPYNFRSREDDPVRQARRTAPFVIIVYHPHRGAWKATWTDKVDILGRLNGTREEVIAWARERCDDIICADPYDVTAPMMPLEPDDE